MLNRCLAYCGSKVSAKTGFLRFDPFDVFGDAPEAASPESRMADDLFELFGDRRDAT